MKNKEVANLIDHTILGADVTYKEVKVKCQEAKEYKFASVCVNPQYVSLTAEELKNTPVKVCTVIGFPLGATLTGVKVKEAKEAIKRGADELDMVINLGALKNEDWELVKDDIATVVEAAQDKIVKVIIETCYLTDAEKEKACQLAKQAGADFVKTSTGFGSGGALEEDIELMRKTVGEEMGVKASGGIKSLTDAKQMIKAGANRIGASSGVQIVKGEEVEVDY